MELPTHQVPAQATHRKLSSSLTGSGQGIPSSKAPKDGEQRMGLIIQHRSFSIKELRPPTRGTRVALSGLVGVQGSPTGSAVFPW
jgi:hypothetical protein